MYFSVAESSWISQYLPRTNRLRSLN